MGGLLARPANPAKIAMATEFVKAAIAKDKVVIFSKSYCPYCTMAKEVRFRHIIEFVWLFFRCCCRRCHCRLNHFAHTHSSYQITFSSCNFTAIQKVEPGIHNHRIGEAWWLCRNSSSSRRNHRCYFGKWKLTYLDLYCDLWWFESTSIFNCTKIFPVFINMWSF